MDAHNGNGGDNEIWEGLEDIIALPNLDEEDGLLPVQNPVPNDINNQLAPQLLPDDDLNNILPHQQLPNQNEEEGLLPIVEDVPDEDDINNQVASQQLPEIEQEGLLPIGDPVLAENEQEGLLPVQNPVPNDIDNQLAPQQLPDDELNNALATEQLPDDDLNNVLPHQQLPDQNEEEGLLPIVEGVPDEDDINNQVASQQLPENEQEGLLPIVDPVLDDLYNQPPPQQLAENEQEGLLPVADEAQQVAIDYSTLFPDATWLHQKKIWGAVIDFFKHFKDSNAAEPDVPLESTTYATAITSNSWSSYALSQLRHQLAIQNNLPRLSAIHNRCPARFPRLRTPENRMKSFDCTVKFFEDFRMQEFEDSIKTTFQSEECLPCYCWTESIHSMLLRIAKDPTNEDPLKGFKRLR